MKRKSLSRLKKNRLSHGLLYGAEDAAFDVGDGLGVNGRQFVDEPVVQRE